MSERNKTINEMMRDTLEDVGSFDAHFNKPVRVVLKPIKRFFEQSARALGFSEEEIQALEKKGGKKTPLEVTEKYTKS